MLNQVNRPNCQVYTDGACKGNPGIGGWGAVIIEGGKQTKIKGHDPLTTNNRMELTAVIKSLEVLEADKHITLFTDSKYVQNGITIWIKNWKKNQWQTSSKKPVKNIDLWQALEVLCENRTIIWEWVKGHAGNEGNEIADFLANAAIEEFLSETKT